ncbi:hypothetical protein CesoFtcFv8_003731 [Champsocephalus esox]|uniref:RecQ-mediated genome instability protein 1 n=1 Tax=Champsocephalus esox TaxID=159716 RepID=A0AAN8CYU9_9TELE|nr:hypothetical protein CesoFtcFv8_003731 [Champsocephalus esox]
MAPEVQAVVHSTQAWLRSSWHVQVPFAWLEACVEWLQEEAGGAGRLSQQQINQQALDQWLLTDLRDLGHPVLPESLSQAQKTELSGTFCVQVDSLLDIGQPAYGQLQKWKGSDVANDDVSAVTQATQRPWEARPTRMLLLQVTDGVQSLEAMEYQSIPALSTALRPGVKLQLQGKMVCRLGMLLLGPSNIKVLGGEVEDLVERNTQGKVLCRTLGVPEEEEQQQQEPAPQQGNQEVEDLDFDDAELLATLEAQEEGGRAQGGPVGDSGYGTLSDTYTQSSRSSSVRSHASTASSRSDLNQSNRGGSVQGRRQGNEHEDFDLSNQPAISAHNMPDEDFPDEDFDDLPLDELDSEIFQESTNITAQSAISHRSTPQNNNNNIPTGNPNRATHAQTAPYDQHTLNDSLNDSQIGSNNSRSNTQKEDYQGFAKRAAALESDGVADDESDFMDEEMDCFLAELDTGRLNQLPVHQGPSKNRESSTNKTDTAGSSCRITSVSSRSVKESAFESSRNTPQVQNNSSTTAVIDRLSARTEPQSNSSAPALSLASPPFTYLSLLEEMMSKPQHPPTEIRVKAFIVTLLGKLSSTNGFWRVCATISDGTGYMDVELSNEVLTGLLGFSVAEKGALKRDPARRGELDHGMRRCQEELVDMCSVMTIVFGPDGGRAVVTRADPINEKMVQQLEQRVRDGRK